MVKARSRPRVRNSVDGTLFGEPISEPLRYLLGQYPFPAALNEFQLRRIRASKNARSVFEKGTVLFHEGDLPKGVCIVLGGPGETLPTFEFDGPVKFCGSPWAFQCKRYSGYGSWTPWPQ
jgi:hypothetical protein